MFHCPRCAKTTISTAKFPSLRCEGCGRLFKPTQALVGVKHAKALGHVTRRAILLQLLEHGEMSPNMISQAMNEGLGQVSYHMKVLKKSGVVKQTRTKPRRGAVEHYYVINAN